MPLSGRRSLGRTEAKQKKMPNHLETMERTPVEADAAVTVIVPSYRRDKSLRETLKMLLAQDIANFDLIVVDQSREHEEETWSFFREHEPRVRRLYQEEPNLPKARNRGLRSARGDYVVFVDDDVLPPPNCLSVLVGHLAAGVADGISGLISFDKTRDELREQYHSAYRAAWPRGSEEVFYVPSFIGAVMAFRREVFELIGGFDDRLGRLSRSAAGEDLEFCRRATRAGVRLALDPKLVINHPLGVAGGCGARELAADVARSNHIRANLYIEMKMTGLGGHIGISGWLRLLRAFAVNRDVLRRGTAALGRGLIDISRNYPAVRTFYRHPD